MSTVNSGLNVETLFNAMFDTIGNKADELNTKMNSLTGEDGNISQEDMLAMQFEINQYNMLLEMTSTVTKSMTDEAKQLAQRAS